MLPYRHGTASKHGSIQGRIITYVKTQVVCCCKSPRSICAMQAALINHSMALAATPQFSVKAKDGKARCGILVTKNGAIQTPSVLLYTRRGGPLSLTSPDMLAAVTPPIQGVQISAMQFLEHPDASILREFGQGAHRFLALDGYPILASNRDPTMYEYGIRPCTDKEVHVSIHSGGHMVTPERYMEIIAALQPDLYVTLCDEVSADSKPKRATTSVRRTAAWLDACLLLHRHYTHHKQPPAPQEPPEGQQQGKQQTSKQQLKQQRRLDHHRQQSQRLGQVQSESVQLDALQPQPQPQTHPQQVAAPVSQGNGTDGPAVLRGHQQGVQEKDEEGRLGEGKVEHKGGEGDQQCTSGSVNGSGSEGVGGGGPLAGSLVLAALGGGAVEAERAKAAEAVADKEGVGGYALCGLGTGEGPAARPGLIAASLSALPPAAAASRPVFAAGLAATPEELLEAVAAGVDLLDCAYVAQVTAGGYALTFPLRPPAGWQPPSDGAQQHRDHQMVAAADDVRVETAGRGEEPSAALSSPLNDGVGAGGADVTLGADDTKINLWSTAYRRDKGPLLPGCGCFACTRHSRAYIHHLLNTHEMLGDVLLEAHNTSHFMAFCQAIREAISEGRFEAYRYWFSSLRSAPLVAPSRGRGAAGAKRRAEGAPEGGEAEAQEAGGVFEGGLKKAAEGGEQEKGAAGRAEWIRL